jgi:anthranilate phosphoribosyltransferase
MDEISFTGDSHIAELKNGEVRQYKVNPSQFGLPLHDLNTIQVANAEESKAMVLDVLAGKPGPARDIVVMNAGAAIYVADVADSLAAGIEAAKRAIDDGGAMRKLEQLRARTSAT